MDINTGAKKDSSYPGARFNEKGVFEGVVWRMLLESLEFSTINLEPTIGVFREERNLEEEGLYLNQLFFQLMEHLPTN
jgi:hypothetical protein